MSGTEFQCYRGSVTQWPVAQGARLFVRRGLGLKIPETVVVRSSPVISLKEGNGWLQSRRPHRDVRVDLAQGHQRSAGHKQPAFVARFNRRDHLPASWRSGMMARLFPFVRFCYSFDRSRPDAWLLRSSSPFHCLCLTLFSYLFVF